MRADRVHQKPVPAVQHLVARPGIAAQQQPDQFVRAGAADDARRVEPVMAADRLAQLAGVAVGIAVDVAGQRAIGGDRALGSARARFRSRRGGSAARRRRSWTRRRYRARCRGCPVSGPEPLGWSSLSSWLARRRRIRRRECAANSAAESGTRIAAEPQQPVKRVAELRAEAVEPRVGQRDEALDLDQRVDAVGTLRKTP